MLASRLATNSDLYLILSPDHRRVTGQRLIHWAKDDIANGQSDVVATPDEIIDVATALLVLADSGTVTVADPDRAFE